MPEEKCENCKFHIGNAGRMWCHRHAPVVMANPEYHKDHQISLSMQPETYAGAFCGDFEFMEKENEH